MEDSTFNIQISEALLIDVVLIGLGGGKVHFITDGIDERPNNKLQNTSKLRV